MLENLTRKCSNKVSKICLSIFWFFSKWQCILHENFKKNQKIINKSFRNLLEPFLVYFQKHCILEESAVKSEVPYKPLYVPKFKPLYVPKFKVEYRQSPYLSPGHLNFQRSFFEKWILKNPLKNDETGF